MPVHFTCLINSQTVSRALAAAAALAIAAPTAASACACGCGVFEVGPDMLASANTGTMVFVEYDFMDQNRNWSGTSRAPASANDDKDIRSHFVTFGAQYHLGGDWSVTGRLPLWSRSFKTDDVSGVETYEHTAIGDVRLTVSWSGLLADKSTSLIAGVKLPSGPIAQSGFDRDTQIGTGSTDLVLGVVHAGTFGLASDWSWYGQVMWHKPLLKGGGYMPGSEINTALGLSYGGAAPVAGVVLKPYLQVIASKRLRDSGADAEPENTGYARLLLAPGIETAADRWRFFGDVELPVLQDVHGYQLIAPVLFKATVSYEL